MFGVPYYNYFDDSSISAIEANEIRDIIACYLIENSTNIDTTAFIQDISVAYNDDLTLCCNDPDDPCCNQFRFNVYVKWGYHY